MQIWWSYNVWINLSIDREVSNSFTWNLKISSIMCENWMFKIWWEECIVSSWSCHPSDRNSFCFFEKIIDNSHVISIFVSAVVSKFLALRFITEIGQVTVNIFHISDLLIRYSSFVKELSLGFKKLIENFTEKWKRNKIFKNLTALLWSCASV